MSETAKCRSVLAQYCNGDGVDLGYGGDAIVPWAICVDLKSPYTRVGNHPRHLSGDASNLFWFNDCALDWVYSSHLLEDFSDTSSVLREWIRVIKPGGRLILYCPDQKRYEAHCRSIGERPNEHHKIHNFSLKYVADILNAMDVKILHQHEDLYSFGIVAERLS